MVKSKFTIQQDEYKVLKKTKSLSPLSGKEVDAKVVLKDGKVYMLKKDESGKDYRALLEVDYDIYKWLIHDTLKKQAPCKSMFISVSDKCNLKCPVCYATPQPKWDIHTPEEMERLLQPYKNKAIILSGMEPTCNPQLVDIIKVVKKRNKAFLLTNGLKLADYNYLMTLKNAGLTRIIFSFNGFDDEVYKKINGAPLLRTKLKALDNISRTNIPTEISVTVSQGINENQLGKIFDFCMENLHFVRVMRIRTQAPIGYYIDEKSFTISELLNLTIQSIGINKNDIFKEYKFLYEFGNTFKVKIPPRRLCSFTFHMKKEKKQSVAIGSRINIEHIDRSKLKRIKLLYNFFRAYGLLYPLEKSYLDRPIAKSKILKIEIRSWPNIYNIDLIENRKCTSRCYDRNGEDEPFCLHNILQEKRYQQSLNNRETHHWLKRESPKDLTQNPDK